MTKLRITLATALLVVVIGAGFFYYFRWKYPGLDIWEAFHSMANPTLRYVKINPGMRKEEVVDRFAETLGWNDAQKQQLIAIHTKAHEDHPEGYYFPGVYFLPINSTPADVSREITQRFNDEIVSKYDKSVKNVINLDTAVKIASIIEREAGSKSDMPIISGVIWNRIFQGMSLEMDATTQYAIGTPKKWWPVVRPEDLKINSPYNTYKNKGFPPTAIASPSADAIWAALNPKKIDTIFYIHDSEGVIHTARTYQEHLANIQKYY